MGTSNNNKMAQGLIWLMTDINSSGIALQVITAPHVVVVLGRFTDGVETNI